jgi:DNA-directed RNA polymerase subunit RPC12/RpoP
MGMFDRVMGGCPNCGRTLEFQSKAGDCTLHTYPFDAVPPEIAKDLAGEVIMCEHCRHEYVLTPRVTVHSVPMVLLDYKRGDESEY